MHLTIPSLNWNELMNFIRVLLMPLITLVLSCYAGDSNNSCGALMATAWMDYNDHGLYRLEDGTALLSDDAMIAILCSSIEVMPFSALSCRTLFQHPLWGLVIGCWVGAFTVGTVWLVDTVAGIMSNLTSSGTGVDTFASPAAVNRFLALEAPQMVGYVDRDKNTDKADLQIFWSRCQVKCDNESIGTMSASRVALYSDVIDLLYVLLFERW